MYLLCVGNSIQQHWVCAVRLWTGRCLVRLLAVTERLCWLHSADWYRVLPDSGRWISGECCAADAGSSAAGGAGLASDVTTDWTTTATVLANTGTDGCLAWHWSLVVFHFVTHLHEQSVQTQKRMVPKSTNLIWGVITNKAFRSKSQSHRVIKCKNIVKGLSLHLLYIVAYKSIRI